MKMKKGFFINPALPKGFDSTENGERPADHFEWWNEPYITSLSIDEHESHVRKNNIRLLKENPAIASHNIAETVKASRESFLKSWPTGVRYDVNCLDGGCHDRPSLLGQYSDLDKAVERCQLKLLSL